MAVHDDARDAARVREPAQVLAIRGLVDGQVGLEGHDVRRHDPREAKRLRHRATPCVQLEMVSSTSLDDTTRPKARPMISSVARWISGHSVATPSLTTLMRYS